MSNVITSSRLGPIFPLKPKNENNESNNGNETNRESFMTALTSPENNNRSSVSSINSYVTALSEGTPLEDEETANQNIDGILEILNDIGNLPSPTGAIMPNSEVNGVVEVPSVKRKFNDTEEKINYIIGFYILGDVNNIDRINSFKNNNPNLMSYLNDMNNLNFFKDSIILGVKPEDFLLKNVIKSKLRRQTFQAYRRSVLFARDLIKVGQTPINSLQGIGNGTKFTMMATAKFAEHTLNPVMLCATAGQSGTLFVLYMANIFLPLLFTSMIISTIIRFFESIGKRFDEAKYLHTIKNITIFLSSEYKNYFVDLVGKIVKEADEYNSNIKQKRKVNAKINKYKLMILVKNFIQFMNIIKESDKKNFDADYINVLILNVCVVFNCDEIKTILQSMDVNLNGTGGPLSGGKKKVSKTKTSKTKTSKTKTSKTKTSKTKTSKTKTSKTKTSKTKTKKKLTH